MHPRITSWRQIFIFSALVTVLAVAVPVIVVAVSLPALPIQLLVKILLISGLIPLFIAFPISLFALYILKVITRAVDLLDAQVKFDGLTGLLTRSYFMTSVEAKRGKGGFLIMLDADRFKSVNDTYGHEKGDEALKHISLILQKATGTAGLSGRLGGEEFAIYLPGATAEQACLLAAAIGTSLRSQPINIDGADVFLTASMGVAHDHPQLPLRNTLKRADVCLYSAKRTGRDRFIIDEQGQARRRA